MALPATQTPLPMQKSTLERMQFMKINRHRHSAVALLVVAFSSNVGFITSLSTRPAIGATVHKSPSNLLPRPSLFGTSERYTGPLHASPFHDQSHAATSRSFVAKKRVTFAAMSNIIHRFVVLRQKIFKAVALLSFAMASFFSPRPAFAASNTKATVVVPETSVPKSNPALKVIVTTASVAAGAAVANKVRILKQDSDEDSNSTIDSQAATSVVETSGLIPAETAPFPDEKPAPPKQTIASKYNKSNKSSPLVKDLDAKIERLKEQEKLALDAAEKVRAEHRAKEEEEKKRKDAVAAQIEKAAQEEEAKRKIAEEEKASKDLAQRKELEEASKEKLRLEQIAKSQAIEVERLEKLVQDNKTAESVKSVEWARKQPKSSEEEKQLKEKYGSMEIEERAFNILVDLGAVDLHSDEWEENDDGDSVNVFL